MLLGVNPRRLLRIRKAAAAWKRKTDPGSVIFVESHFFYLPLFSFSSNYIISDANKVVLFNFMWYFIVNIGHINS